MTSSKKSFEEDGSEQVGSDEAQPSEVQPGEDLGQAEVQAKFDEANDKGYFGEVPDETPNSAYTLQGVTSGESTPETERGK